MQPFWDYDLRKVIDNQLSKVNEHIEKYTNDEIMANDLNLLADNCYEQFYIEPITINDEDVSERSVTSKKFKRRIDSFFRHDSEQEYVWVDGYAITFSFPYHGDTNLFKCQASTFLLSGYPDIGIEVNHITFYYELPLKEMQTDEDKSKLMKRLEQDVASIKKGVSYVNSDVSKFNQSLKQNAINEINARKKKVEQFYTVSNLFEIPISKTRYASTHIPVQRKIQPINKKYSNESNYSISNEDYLDILKTIKHNGSTYERTPNTFYKLQEENIRDLLLAALNGVYQGKATGETFRNKGKTDICIECDNRAAFVAECKVWKGQGKINEDIEQLDGYLTWRDCKTALIYFVRNKEFLPILDRVKQSLESNPFIQQVKEIDRNEIDFSYKSQSNLGQVVRIRVFLFNLYVAPKVDN